MTRDKEITMAALDYSETTDLYLAPIDLAEAGFKAGAAWADAHPHWISVEERLPNEGDDVAAFDKHGCKDALFFKYGKFYSIYGNWHKDVTHWMPLPSPNLSERPTSSEIPNNCEKGGSQ